MAVPSRHVVALAASLSLLAQVARADDASPPPPPPEVDLARVPEDPTLRKVEPQRRNGVVLGFQTGVGFGAASGYPNSPRLIGNPDYYSSTPLMVGGSSSIFFMGALADWVSFGPMISWANFENDKWRSTGFGVGFRLETFPLLTLVPALADTSLYTQLGIGSTQLRAKGDYPDADGTQSFLGLGVHHEFRVGRLLGGHFALGPHVEYDVITSEPIERHWLTVGLRVVWYGGKVKADQ